MQGLSNVMLWEVWKRQGCTAASLRAQVHSKIQSYWSNSLSATIVGRVCSSRLNLNFLPTHGNRADCLWKFCLGQQQSFSWLEWICHTSSNILLLRMRQTNFWDECTSLSDDAGSVMSPNVNSRRARVSFGLITTNYHVLISSLLCNVCTPLTCLCIVLTYVDIIL